MGNPAIQSLDMRAFIEWEAAQPGKFEFLDGQVYAMTGARPAHDRVRNNVVIALGQHLIGSGCEIYGADLAFRPHPDRARFYPDALVICDPDALGPLEATSARWILEVLSPSTQGRDRVEKWNLYRDVAALQEYVLIDPVFWRVEIHRRSADGSWALPFACDPAAPVRFESLDFETTFDVIFRAVPKPPADELR